MVSEFTDQAGFRRAYREVRGGILAAHNLPADAPRVRLATGLVIMDVLIGERWVPYTDGAQVDMLDRVRLGGRFRLRCRS